MRVLRIEGLPEGAIEAAAAFYADWAGEVLISANPPRNGEVARSAGGVEASPDSTSLAESSRPLRPASGGPPPRSGEDFLLVFPPADHTHRAWRLAAVQSLARKHASLRVNAVAAASEAAIQSALAYLASAPGLTGQYLPLDDAGAGTVVSVSA